MKEALVLIVTAQAGVKFWVKFHSARAITYTNSTTSTAITSLVPRLLEWEEEEEVGGEPDLYCERNW